MFALKRLMPAASLCAVLTLAACSDSLSPGDVDPEVLQSGMTSAGDTFTQNAIFQSVLLLSDHFPAYGVQAVGYASATLSRVRSPNGPVAAAAARHITTMGFGLAASPQALFPSDVLGKTLAWDAQTSGYVVTNQTGAPANGIRILLYFTNSATGMPFLPVTPIGSLDLTDKSTAQANKLGVVLTFGQTTVGAYDITLVSSTSSVTATAVGYLQAVAGSDRIDFNLHDVLSVSGQSLSLVSTNDITHAGTSIHVVLNQSDIFSGGASLVARVQRGNATIELTGTGDLGNRTGPISGNIKFNNTSVATISGSFEDPAIAGTGGHTFTAEQVDAMLVIFGTAIDFAFDFSNGIFAPGSIVF
jgi:hypothetical protein